MAFEQLESYFATDVGRVRDNNEDAVLDLPEHGIFCVADGMGGAHGGEVASRMVVDNIRAAFTGAPSSRTSSLDTNIETLRRAVESADAEIKAWAHEHGSVGTGTTLVALVFDPQCSFFGSVFHAGDSRAYRYRKGALTRLSTDHSIAGALGIEDERHLPSSFHNVITHAIGAHDGANLEETTFDMEEGDLFLLCSDGLTRMLNDDEIAAVIGRCEAGGLQKMASELVDGANAAGGMDNISLGLIRAGTDQPARAGAAETAAVDVEPGPGPQSKDVSRVDEVASRFLAQRKAASAPELSAIPGSAPLASADGEPGVQPDPAQPESEPSHSATEKPEPAGVPAADTAGWRPRPDSVSPHRIASIFVLVVAASIAAAVYVFHVSAGRNRSSAPPEGVDDSVLSDAARVGPLLGDTAAEPVTDDETAEVRLMVADAMETGKWGALKLVMLADAARSEEILAKADLLAVYRGWLYLWEKNRYSESPGSAEAEYIAYCDLMQELLDASGNEDVPIDMQSQWPDSPEARADFVCRESYRLRQMLLEKVTSNIDELDRRISVFQGDRSAALNALCSMGTGESGRAERMGAAFIEAESRILALYRSIAARRSLPPDALVLTEIVRSVLPAVSESVSVVGELLRQNLLVLSAGSIRDACGEDGISDGEVGNILIMRDRLLQPKTEPLEAEDDAGRESDWFNEVNVEQVGSFLQHLARKHEAG